MATRYIYISEELNDKLREEKNASKLISQLLYEHYQKTSLIGLSKEELLKVVEIEKIKEQAMRKIEELNGQ